jgi:hypothetical protein
MREAAVSCSCGTNLITFELTSRSPNAVAFSPTDVMSLTRRVKMMMLAEAAVSAMTTLLVAAEAVNILR